MRDVPNDRFARYYAEKLWEMIPAVYRHEDGIAEKPDVLRALVEVLADQAAIVRRSSDRAWEDQFIDLSDDWAVAYLGDLVGTRMISALDRRGRRADVANTIFYRRRAGTLAVLEGLIADITGWEGTVVEEFRRLVRYPHGLDPAPARPGSRTGTPAHGLPDMRQPRGSRLAESPWDEFHHLPDVRRNHGGADGRYGITKLAFHLYRLLAFPVVRATPRALAPAPGGTVRFTFDPSGRTIPLYQRHSRPTTSFELDWRAALEWELPAPMRCEVLADAEFVVTEADILALLGDATITGAEADGLRTIRGIRFPSEERFRIRLDALPPATLGLAAIHRVLADSLVADCGKGALLPASATAVNGDDASVSVERLVTGTLTLVPRELVVAGNLSGTVPTPVDKLLVIDAENGLGYFTAGTPEPGATGSYCYGFSGNLGAGTYPRAGLRVVPSAGHVSGGGALTGLAAVDALREIDDSATYGPVTGLSVKNSTTVQARNRQRPYLDLAGDWTIRATQPASALVLDGLWLGGAGPRTVHLAAQPNAAWSTVTLRSTTLDPGGLDADGGPVGPVVLSVESPIAELSIEGCILGPVVIAGGGLVERLIVRRSILHTTDTVGHPDALSQPRGATDIRGCTVIGRVAVHELDASELLCTDTIVVDELQAGCVRFSAFAAGSRVPRAYRTQAVADPRSLFTSTRFGDPGYGQLSDLAPDELVRGGEDGTEIGAFTSLLTPIKLESLKTKVDEFLPFGLIPHYITET